MMSSTQNAYDTMPYPSLAFLQTHPDRLAVMATLFGMDPPSVERCRVLELACGDGSNLTPMAYAFPGSEFVGVDLAAKPIAFARDRIRRFGLKNIRVEAMDLMEIGADSGKFDYIIAHGVYAWVPEAVQAKILSICGANLNTNGVAFVSYNTNPAGHVRRMLREMAQFHESRCADPVDRVKSGKDFLESILKSSDARPSWKALLQEELRSTFSRDEKVVYHDDLAACFLPVSFGEFVKRAAEYGLQYLCEALLSEVMALELGEETPPVLKELARGDHIALDQYLDFAKFRRFRQTLLCHADVPLRRDAVVERIGSLLVASPMISSAKAASGAVEFTNSRGTGKIETNNPLIIAAIRRLEAIWPRGESFEALANAIVLTTPSIEQGEALASLKNAVMQLTANALVDLRTCDPPLPHEVGEKPEASSLARLMLQEGGLVTTLLHTHLNVEDEQGKKFLQLLDGTRDRHSLAQALAAEAPDVSFETILQQVDANLLNCYKMGLLVSR